MALSPSLPHGSRSAQGLDGLLRKCRDLKYGIYYNIIGCPLLRYSDVCKRDMKALDIDVASWVTTAANRDAWELTLQRQLPEGESRWNATVAEKRARRKAKATEHLHRFSIFIRPNCGRDCKARIGLLSHSKKCGT